jgi:phospholipid/cholesterol/gamma-HCH transport system permease protein
MTPEAANEPRPVTLRSETDPDGTLRVVIEGRLDAATTALVWGEAGTLTSGPLPEKVVLDGSAVEYCDGAGIGLLFRIERRITEAGSRLEIRGLRDSFRRLLDAFDPADTTLEAVAPPERRHVVEEIGRESASILRDMRLQVAFVGELSLLLARAVLHPRRVRWQDTFLAMEQVGVNAFGIVALIGFLIGVILAYQSANALDMFGAEIFVANLVGLSILRELGPLMAAILLAGRSGSAFAAEIGTMKVNEEIDALATMGLDPTNFLVVPRVIATILMIPILTLFLELFGLIGGGAVYLNLGFSLNAYFQQTFSTLDLSDFLGGLFKGIVFGVMVAGIGCLRGLQTGTGARAVGISATRAVVSGLILIIFADGVFSVVYHYLGI